MVNRRWVAWGIRIFGLLAAAWLMPAQTITSLQSSAGSDEFPTHGAAITAGTNVGGVMVLYINGNFDPTQSIQVQWDLGDDDVMFLPVENVSSTQIIAFVDSDFISSPGTAAVTVIETPEESETSSTSNAVNFTINPFLDFPDDSSVLPSGIVGNVYSQPLTFGGTPSFSASSDSGVPPGLSTSSLSGNLLSGTPTLVGTYSFSATITDSWNNSFTGSYSISILPGFLITTTSLPNGTVGSPYSATLSRSGGVAPFHWTASGLPSGLGINNTTGVITGTPISSGNSTVLISVSDSSENSTSVSLSLRVNAPAVLPPPALTLTPSLPSGMVGQIYVGLIAPNGGTGDYKVSVTGGSLPPGVALAFGGQLYGTPTTPGTFSFTVTATDSSNNAVSGSFSILILPATVSITGAPPTTISVNTPLSVLFGATGGVAPYTLSFSGTAPPGTSFSGGTLSGLPSTAGTFSFTVNASDSEKPPATASKSFSVTVTPAPLNITASLPTGFVGKPYSGSFAVSGGVGPFTWSGSASGGLSVSNTGAVSGTPTAVGTISITVTVTDSTGAKNSGTFSLTVNLPPITVTTTSLPNGALTASYSASLSASGGTQPYTWTAGGLPDGLGVSSSGAITGTPTTLGTFTVSVSVKDSMGAAANANLSITITPAPLRITTTGLSPVQLGQSFSVGFGATGGAPPYTWSASGLPGGVSISSSGTVSGTPTALGTSSITVTVTDSNKQTASASLSLVVALPTAPNVTLPGLPTNATPGSQSTTSVTLGATYPTDVTVTLTLTFTPTSGGDDPNIQFSTGGRTVTLTVKAGATTSTSSVGVQTGTVAGIITITTQLTASGTDITPSPAPVRSITIPAAAPTISRVTTASASGGFTVTVIGFDPTRAITQATFTFTPASGSTLQSSTVTVSAQSLFTAWYQSTASAQYGSQFNFTIPFTVSGSVSGIASVTVTLTNPTGTSNSVTATVL
jgi:hypothetical protein